MPRARAPPARARATPPRSSCVAGPSPDSRTQRGGDSRATIAPSTRGPLERQAAPRAARAGSAGGAANASAAAPGRGGTGSSRPTPRTALAPRRDAELAVRVRTAHAQAVGPCTSTPFCSAIPPRRTVSSATRQVASDGLRRRGAGTRPRARGRRPASARRPSGSARAAISRGIARSGKKPYATVPKASAASGVSVNPATPIGASRAPGSSLRDERLDRIPERRASAERVPPWPPRHSSS